MSGSRRARSVVAIVAGSTLIPAAGSAAPSPPISVVFGGETTQREVITIEVDPERTKILSLQFSWTADCTLGPAATSTTETSTGWTVDQGPFKINLRGAWRKSKVVNAVEGQVKQRFTYSFAGRRVGGRMKGSLRASLAERDDSGLMIRTCSAPATRFAVTEPHVFGGVTRDSRDPMFAIMNPARNKVVRLRWDWIGTCLAGPAAGPDTQMEVTIRDSLAGGYRVDRTGRLRFLGSETLVEPGLSTTFTYKAVARRIGQTIKGSITSSFVEIDTTSGGVIRECASAGPIKFTVKN